MNFEILLLVLIAIGLTYLCGFFFGFVSGAKKQYDLIVENANRQHKERLLDLQGGKK